MYYSLIGFLALCILIIANYDILLKRTDHAEAPVQRIYYRFLLCILAYYVTDILWGALDTLALPRLLYADTVIYFLAMAAGILTWTRYVFAYLEEENLFRTISRYVGLTFFAAVCLLLEINFIKPILFSYDAAGAYQTGLARKILLIVQVLIFLLTSLYAMRGTGKTKDSNRQKHLVIGLVGLIMAVLLSVQFFFPLLPLCSIGYMLGSSLLRTFVIESEKEAYQKDLEASLQREQKQLGELFSAWEVAYTDALTGAKSKFAYLEKETQIEKAIASGTAAGVAIVAFDVNGLKRINDTMGHDAGDKYITDSYALIKEVFQKSPVFRIGGDEFTVILEGDDHANRAELMERFDRLVEENRRAGRVVVSAGMAEYRPGVDFSFERVFKRADRLMYQRKEELKRREAGCA